ncbi:cytochrome c biogenesis CcdA family protein [Oceanobacter sp. 4_MG-2023]|uniref:cytochrome c biogenesis CcdA family protein n=1 Tax=Oceanobacter sp. 4_MG-2023 TaxID=3062623 RepID=UPI0027324065|nr:cytochrome c biogenesis CcdA family protein [Oceanobacter sp. 4_MG-2023]MDP2548450.1 cytochrome c biogenesis CcdA family protein [Oceanobacter sp. 4_MG-2023]
MLEFSSIPLAFVAGMLSILSPCVWPLLPMTVGVARANGKMGVLAMGAGLSLAFAIAGSLLTFVLVSLGLDPELFRYFSAALLIVMGLILVIRPLADALTLRLSMWMSRRNINSAKLDWMGPFGTGLLTGIVWLPCVGPTLGAAIALASVGQDLALAFVIMLAFGLGTAAVMIVAGLTSSAALRRLNNRMISGGRAGKYLLGSMMLLLGLSVLLGIDKLAERWAVGWLPTWMVSF